MACLRYGGRSLINFRRSLGSTLSASYSTPSVISTDSEVVTHTGQKFESDDYRRARFLKGPKLVRMIILGGHPAKYWSPTNLSAVCGFVPTALSCIIIAVHRGNKVIVHALSPVTSYLRPQYSCDATQTILNPSLPETVNEHFAINLVKEDPVVVCSQRVVMSDSGGPLGHPRVFINLDQPEIHTCGYSGRRFVLKKYYDVKTMGPSVTYDQYLKEIGHDDD